MFECEKVRGERGRVGERTKQTCLRLFFDILTFRHFDVFFRRTGGCRWD